MACGPIISNRPSHGTPHLLRHMDGEPVVGVVASLNAYRYFATVSNCGSESVMSYHGAFEPTKM